MKNREYWIERFSELEKAIHRTNEESLEKINFQYRRAQKEIEANIQIWCGRIASNNGISMASARRLLNANELEEFHWTVEEYIKHGKESNLSPQWEKQLENASAKFHIERLEALQLELQHSIEVLYGSQEKELNELLQRNYKDCYYHTCFEIQKGVGAGWKVAAVDQNQLGLVVKTPWGTDEKTFSDRLWKNKTILVNELQIQLSRNIMLGKSPDQSIEVVAKKFETSKKQAGCLVMTESAWISANGQKKAFQELGVKEFEVVVTLDSRTSAICQEMDGRHFPMEEYQSGITAPPFHRWCRSTTAPCFDDDWGMRAARDGKNGETYYIPENITYKEWQNKVFAEGERYDKIKERLKAAGIKGEIDLHPALPQVNELLFDDEHINRQRGHGVSKEEAILYMTNALFSITKWNGKFTNYYSEDGAVYVDNELNTIRTAFKREEYDDVLKACMEVVRDE